jgi:hypothetical protein
MTMELVRAEAVKRNDVGDFVDRDMAVGDEIANEGECEAATSTRFEHLPKVKVLPVPGRDVRFVICIGANDGLRHARPVLGDLVLRRSSRLR